MKSERISPFWVGGYHPFSAILDVVYFGSKLYALVLLASDDRTDVRAANADNALLYFLFES